MALALTLSVRFSSDCVVQEIGVGVNLAGKPAVNAATSTPRFIVLAFRVYREHKEYIYLRPSQGRARRSYLTDLTIRQELLNRLELVRVVTMANSI